MTNTAQNIIAAGFDIANLSAIDEAPATLKVDLLFNDDGDAIAGVIIVGKNSPEYRNENNVMRAEGIKRGARTATAIDAKTDDGAMKFVNLTNEGQRRLALAVSVDWWGFTNGGVDVPFSKELLNNGLGKYSTWIDLIHAGLAKDAAFLKV